MVASGLPAPGQGSSCCSGLLAPGRIGTIRPIRAGSRLARTGSHATLDVSRPGGSGGGRPGGSHPLQRPFSDHFDCLMECERVSKAPCPPWVLGKRQNRKTLTREHTRMMIKLLSRQTLDRGTMMSRHSDLTEAILICVAEVHEEVRAAPPPPKWPSWDYGRSQESLEFGPLLSTIRWFGALAASEAQRVACLRTVYQLSGGRTAGGYQERVGR